MPKPPKDISHVIGQKLASSFDTSDWKDPQSFDSFRKAGFSIMQHYNLIEYFGKIFVPDPRIAAVGIEAIEASKIDYLSYIGQLILEHFNGKNPLDDSFSLSPESISYLLKSTEGGQALLSTHLSNEHTVTKYLREEGLSHTQKSMLLSLSFLNGMPKNRELRTTLNNLFDLQHANKNFLSRDNSNNRTEIRQLKKDLKLIIENTLMKIDGATDQMINDATHALSNILQRLDFARIFSGNNLGMEMGQGQTKFLFIAIGLIIVPFAITACSGHHPSQGDINNLNATITAQAFLLDMQATAGLPTPIYTPPPTITASPTNTPPPTATATAQRKATSDTLGGDDHPTAVTPPTIEATDTPPPLSEATATAVSVTAENWSLSPELHSGFTSLDLNDPDNGINVHFDSIPNIDATSHHLKITVTKHGNENIFITAENSMDRILSAQIGDAGDSLYLLVKDNDTNTDHGVLWLKVNISGDGQNSSIKTTRTNIPRSIISAIGDLVPNYDEASNYEINTQIIDGQTVIFLVQDGDIVPHSAGILTISDHGNVTIDTSTQQNMEQLTINPTPPGNTIEGSIPIPTSYTEEGVQDKISQAYTMTDDTINFGGNDYHITNIKNDPWTSTFDGNGFAELNSIEGGAELKIETDHENKAILFGKSDENGKSGLRIIAKNIDSNGGMLDEWKDIDLSTLPDIEYGHSYTIIDHWLKNNTIIIDLTDTHSGGTQTTPGQVTRVTINSNLSVSYQIIPAIN